MMNNDNRVAIDGNTYPVKNQLSKLGARWNGNLRKWMIAPEKLEQANAIVAGNRKAPAAPLPAACPEPALAHNWSDEQNAIFAWFAMKRRNKARRKSAMKL